MPGAGRAAQDLVGVGGIIPSGSCDVLVNKKGAVRRGDLVKPHLSTRGKKHPPVPMAEGTCAVLVNGRPIVRAGHKAVCGDSLLVGSCDVQVGDQNRIPELDPNTSTLFTFEDSAPANLVDPNKKIAIFGDSVSMYGGVILPYGADPTVESNYITTSQKGSITTIIKELFPTYTVTNVSRGGMTTDEALTGVQSYVGPGLPNPYGASVTITQWIIDNSPNKIVLRLGLADAILINNSTTTLNNIQTIINFAVARGIEVILVSVNPAAVNGTPGNCGYMPSMSSAAENAAIAINAGIISKAQSQGLKYANPRVLTPPACFTPDGIHPFESYGIVIGEEILRQLRLQVPASEQYPYYNVNDPNSYYNSSYTNPQRNQEKPNKAPDFVVNGGITDQPITQCQGTGLTVLPFLSRCLQEAKSGLWRESGQSGTVSNQNIINMWRNLGLSFSSDQVPWCAGFACFAMKQSGMKWIREPGARNLINKYTAYDGQPVPISQMQPGDLVLWSSTHVNFCFTANNGRYTFVGGNQTPNPTSGRPVRDPKNDGDVSISWPGGWTTSQGGIERVIRIKC